MPPIVELEAEPDGGDIRPYRAGSAPWRVTGRGPICRVWVPLSLANTDRYIPPSEPADDVTASRRIVLCRE